MFWGAQTVFANVSRLANLSSGLLTPGAARLTHLLFLAVALPTTYFLVEFAHAQRGRTGSPALWMGARFLAGAVALLGAVILVFQPAFLYNGLVPMPDRVLPAWGPLYPWLIVVPQFVAFGVALAALHATLQRSPTPRTAERATILLAGLGIYVAFAASNNAVFYVGTAFFPEAFGGPAGPVTFQAVVFAVLFLTLALVALRVGIASWLSARAAPHDPSSRRDRLVALALLLPLGWGAIEGYLALETFPLLETVGLWRLAGVAVIAYGIARWRIYDLPQRAQRAAAAAAGTGAAFATGAAAYGAGTVASASSAVPVVAGLVVFVAAFIPTMQFARRLFGVDRARERRDLESALYGQRIDSYRAALEASLARGTLAEDQQFLAALRERFHITPDEDRLLAHLAHSSVLVPRETRAWDAYERLRLLGEGGGGRTWLARDRARDRLVVLKEPLERWQQDPAAREMVLREARLAAKVRHPNIVAVEEVVEGRGSPVIVMEYMEGGSLRDVLRAKGTLPWPEAKTLALDLLRGLEAIHAAGIVHRDIKPNNILLDGDGVAKLADFGIAVAPATASQRTMRIDPMNSTIAGTLHYMAPEARAGATPDKRADVFSAAAVLHEMLYAAPPGLVAPTVVRQDLPQRLPTILAAALASDPQARTPSARALAEEIARL